MLQKRWTLPDRPGKLRDKTRSHRIKREKISFVFKEEGKGPEPDKKRILKLGKGPEKSDRNDNSQDIQFS